MLTVSANNQLTENDYENLRWNAIKAMEGVRYEPYLDTANPRQLTIGVGFNIEGNSDLRLEVYAALHLDQIIDAQYISDLTAAIGNHDIAQMNQIMLDRYNSIPQAQRAGVPDSFTLPANTNFRDIFDISSGAVTDSAAAGSNSYEARLNTWLGAGALVASRERVALLSLMYNGLLQVGIGGADRENPTLQAAVRSDNRIDAWYQIRYQSNGGAADGRNGIAKRRYYESALFGLYKDENSVLEDESEKVYQMFTEHRTFIMNYERDYAGTINGTKSGTDANAIQDYGLANSPYRPQFLEQELQAAANILISEYGEGSSISPLDIYVGGTGNDTITASSRDGYQLGSGTAHPSLVLGGDGNDIITGGDANDVLYGEIGEDTLTGGLGADTMYGGEGRDVYHVDNSGHDVIFDNVNNSQVYLNGRRVTYAIKPVAGGASEPTVYQTNIAGLTVELNGSDLVASSDVGDGFTLKNFDKENANYGFLLIDEPDYADATIVQTTPEWEKWNDINYALSHLGPMTSFWDGMTPDDTITFGDGKDGTYELDFLVEKSDPTPDIHTGSLLNKGQPIEGINYFQLATNRENSNNIDFFEAQQYFYTGADILNNPVANSIYASDSHGYEQSGLQGEITRYEQLSFAPVLSFSGTVDHDFIRIGGNKRVDFSAKVEAGDGNDVIISTKEIYVPVSPTQAVLRLSDYAHQREDDVRGHYLDGGNGDDFISGYFRDDFIVGGAGRDVLWGAMGNDVLLGGEVGNNLADNDLIFGGIGNDTIIAGSGNDTLIGNQDNDIIYAGEGNDVILGDYDGIPVFETHKRSTDFWLDEMQWGAVTYDPSTPNPNNSTKIVTDKWSTDFVSYGYLTEEYHSGDDVIYAEGGNDTVIAYGGNDTVYGGDGDDYIQGNAAANPDGYGSDDDLLFGDNGNDIIYGQRGNDTLLGGEGIDKLYGDVGADYLQGDSGNDFIDGGSDSDTIIGGLGTDTLFGGAGDDLYVYSGGDGSDTIDDNSGSNRLIISDDLQISKLIDWGDIKRINFTNGENITWQNSSYSSFSINKASGEAIDLNAIDMDIDMRYTSGTVTAGSGNDTIHVDHEKSSVVHGGAGNDNIEGRFYGSGAVGAVVFFGDDGDDYIYSRNGFSISDTFIGGRGNDTLYSDWEGGDVVIFNDGDGVDILSGEPVFGHGTNIDIYLNTAYSVNYFADSKNKKITIKYGVSDQFDMAYYLEGQFPDIFVNNVKQSDLTFTVVGTQGNDALSGSDSGYYTSKNVYYGEVGNDTLTVDGGGDIVYFGRGDGQDLVNRKTSTNKFILNFKQGVSPDDISIQKLNNDAIFVINGTTDIVTVKDFFLYSPSSANNPLSFVRFYDESTISPVDIQNIVFRGTELNDSIVGTGGDDVISGGKGNDWLAGGSGNDTYVFSSGDGFDSMYGGPGDDVIYIKGDISKSDLSISRERFDNGNRTSVVVSYPGGKITLADYFVDNSEVESNTFSSIYFVNSGVEITREEIYSMLLSKPFTSGNDIQWGYSKDDNFNGLDGHDTIYGGGGNDTIRGDAGSDILRGESGNDFLYGDEGSDWLVGGIGNDNLLGGDDNDHIEGGDGLDLITPGKGDDYISIDNLDKLFYSKGDGSDEISYSSSVPEVHIYFDLSIANNGMRLYREYGPVYGGTSTTQQLSDAVLVLNGSPLDRLYINNFYSGSTDTALLSLNLHYSDNSVVNSFANVGAFQNSTNESISWYGAQTYSFSNFKASTSFDDYYDGRRGGIGYIATGGDGNDIFIGSDRADALNGSYGNDTFYFQGGFGNDSVRGYGNKTYLDCGPVGSGATVATFDHLTNVNALTVGCGGPGNGVQIDKANAAADAYTFTNAIFGGNAPNRDFSAACSTGCGNISVNVKHSNVQTTYQNGGVSITFGAGNVAPSDPLFVDAANGDFHLKSKNGHWATTTYTRDTVDSPALKAGDPAGAVIGQPPRAGDRSELGTYGNSVEASLVK